MIRANGSEPGALLAERLGIVGLRNEGHDVVAACISCDSSDGFRVHRETGIAHCHVCKAGYSRLKLAETVLGSQPAAWDLLAELGLEQPRQNGHGHAAPVDPVEAIARAKRIPLESFKAYGAKTSGEHCASLPAYGPDGAECSTFTIWAAGDETQLKGKFAPKKPAGLFFPHDGAAVRLPMTGETWHVVEGPKDAAALHSLGLLAAGLNTCAMAAKFARLFKGVDVVLIPDRDAAGVEGTEKSARVLCGQAASIKIAALPAELKDKRGDDVRDILRRDNGAEQVLQAIADAQPWEMPRSDEPGGSVTNAELVETVDDDGERKIKAVPMPMVNVLARIKSATGGWPRRVGSALFADRGDGQVDWFETPSATFGWLGSKTGTIHWHRGTGFATKEETFSELRRTATAYDAVETLPHFPSMPRHFYACKPAKIGNGDALRRFLDRFRPSTQIDYDLFLAAVVTPFWGGPPGCRPAFMWISDSGRGAGKSKNAAMVARVAGGVMDFSHGEDIATIKARLLSPEGQSCRVAMLDNVKTLRFSWAEIESLITQTTISGKRMYVGEAARPNTITWFITLNGASLSTDMAQRVIPIKIDPPERVGSWEEETIRFIDDNRQALIDDVAAFFSQPAYPPRQFTRWATWEQHVLARLPEPNEAQAVIRERQGVADVEREEADIIEDHFRGRLAELCYAAETDRVHIPSLTACQWFNEATGEKKGTTAATRAIKQLCDEDKMTCLQIDPSRTHGRGFLWFGESAEVNAVTRTDLASRIEKQKRRS